MNASVVEQSAAAQKRAANVTAIKLIPDLLAAFNWNRTEDVRSIAEQMAVCVEAHHPSVAARLRRTAGQVPQSFAGFDKIRGLVDFDTPRFGLDAVILPESILNTCKVILQEHANREALSTFSLCPRHKIFLHGTPGNGKTMLAEALAFEFGLPFLRINHGTVVESYLGQTNANLKKVIEFASRTPCVLFFDEFDGIGMKRSHGMDVVEMRRVTNLLLVEIERLPSDCVFVAATNEEELIDPALARRFDVVLEIASPSEEMRRRCIEKELAPEITPGYDLRSRFERLARLPLTNLDAVTKLCRRIRRDLVLNGGGGFEDLILACRHSVGQDACPPLFYSQPGHQSLS